MPKVRHSDAGYHRTLLKKQAFFQEESLGTRPVQGPVRCPTSRHFRTPKRRDGSSHPGRRSRPAARGAAALTAAATPAYFTKRSVPGSCEFGKLSRYTGRIYRQVDQRLHTRGPIDGIGAEIVLGLPEFQIAFFTMP